MSKQQTVMNTAASLPHLALHSTNVKLLFTKIVNVLVFTSIVFSQIYSLICYCFHIY